MIEELYKLSDFKAAIEKRGLDIKKLRLGEEVKEDGSGRGIFFRHTFILSIPDTYTSSKFFPSILICKPYSEMWAKSVGDDERKEQKEIVEKITKNLNEEFGVDEITLGEWKV